MTIALSKDDEGKRVIESDGSDVGMVAEVRHGTAHVEAEPGIVEALQTELDAGGSDENTYAVSEEDVERIDDETVVLRTRD
jgi:sporulation protein YlmC with PRC-barrel domain